jgi:hypothetical protein
LPVSIARYSTFAHHHVPYAVTIFVDMIYLSNGLFNVLLFSITRPFLLPHDPPNPNMTFHVMDTSLSGGPDDGTDTDAYAHLREASLPNYYRLQPESSYDLTLQWSTDGEASLVRKPLGDPRFSGT